MSYRVCYSQHGRGKECLEEWKNGLLSVEGTCLCCGSVLCQCPVSMALVPQVGAGMALVSFFKFSSVLFRSERGGGGGGGKCAAILVILVKCATVSAILVTPFLEGKPTKQCWTAAFKN